MATPNKERLIPGYICGWHQGDSMTRLDDAFNVATDQNLRLVNSFALDPGRVRAIQDLLQRYNIKGSAYRMDLIVQSQFGISDVTDPDNTTLAEIAALLSEGKPVLGVRDGMVEGRKLPSDISENPNFNLANHRDFADLEKQIISFNSKLRGSDLPDPAVITNGQLRIDRGLRVFFMGREVFPEHQTYQLLLLLAGNLNVPFSGDQIRQYLLGTSELFCHPSYEYVNIRRLRQALGENGNFRYIVHVKFQGSTEGRYFMPFLGNDLNETPNPRFYQDNTVNSIRFRGDLRSEIVIGDQRIHLTPNEGNLLRCLMEREGFTPNETLKVAVWDTTEGVSNNTLAIIVNHLNRKLRPMGFAIIAREKFGYTLISNIE